MAGDATHFTQAEEAYASRLAEKIPGVKPSERAYVAYLNRLRADSFTQSVKHLKQTPMSVAEYDTATKSLARHINAATGRGDLGKLEAAAKPLSTVIWAPRLIASRIQLMNPVEYARMPKAVRVQALRDMGAASGTLASVLALGKLSGQADVSVDPRNADFLKLRIGDTRLDLGGGFLQYLRLGAMLTTGERVTSGGRVKKLDGPGKYPETRLSTIAKFAEQRTPPAIGFIINGLRNWHDADGRTVKLSDEAINRLAPMLERDLYDAYKADPKTGAKVTIPAVFGGSLATYGGDDDKKKTGGDHGGGDHGGGGTARFRPASGRGYADISARPGLDE